MTTPAIDAFLPTAFRTFVDEVCRVERDVRAMMAQGAAARSNVRPTPAADLRARLVAVLEQQKNDGRAQGRDPESSTFQAGQNLMATLADTIFQGLDWWGRKPWLEQPLAGDFPVPDGFSKDLAVQVADYLKGEDHDSELAQLYLLALATDAFVGEDAGAGGSSAVRRRLLEVLSEPFPELSGNPEYTFPEAYRRRQLPGPATLLPATRGWWIGLAVAAGLLLAISAPLWLRATQAARQAVEQILAPGSTQTP